MDETAAETSTGRAGVNLRAAVRHAVAFAFAAGAFSGAIAAWLAARGWLP